MQNPKLITIAILFITIPQFSQANESYSKEQILLAESSDRSRLFQRPSFSKTSSLENSKNALRKEGFSHEGFIEMEARDRVYRSWLASIEKAKRKIEKEDYSGAISIYDEILRELHPDHLKARIYVMGEKLSAMKHYGYLGKRITAVQAEGLNIRRRICALEYEGYRDMKSQNNRALFAQAKSCVKSLNGKTESPDKHNKIKRSKYHPEPLTNAEKMTPGTILGTETKDTTSEQRCTWYHSKLLPYTKTINEAAIKVEIPSQLLATVILNELADVDWKDVQQEYSLLKSGCKKVVTDNHLWFMYRDVGIQSFGIAQITPITAMKYSAIDFPSKARASRDIKELWTACQLLDRQVSIHAASRIIRKILERMEQQSTSPLMRRWSIKGERFNARSPYSSLGPPIKSRKTSKTRLKEIMRQRVSRLGYLVTMIYNSDSTLEMSKAQLDNENNYKDAKRHADNGRSIASDLYENNACGIPLSHWKPKVHVSKGPF